jgi:hypothetical protein
MDEDKAILSEPGERVRFSALLEVGGAWEQVDNRDGTDGSRSDINLTTFLLGIETGLNPWMKVLAVFLYEDPAFGQETDVTLDVATLTIGNQEKLPVLLTAGAMYVPFGALLTHFPDDPLIDQPLTLLLGETREKAALLSFSHKGVNLSGYVFNGDVDEAGKGDHVEQYGFDARYGYEGSGLEIMAGGSYISNLADSDGLTDALLASGTNVVQDRIAGLAAYIHLGFAGYFLDAEYMTAVDDFRPSELSTISGAGAEPSVWNLEGGYKFAWARSLEIALKYAGSDETEGLGFPERRYGIVLNQEIFENVIGSLAFLHDEFDEGDAQGRDERNILFGQIGVSF